MKKSFFFAAKITKTLSINSKIFYDDFILIQKEKQFLILKVQ